MYIYSSHYSEDKDDFLTIAEAVFLQARCSSWCPTLSVRCRQNWRQLYRALITCFVIFSISKNTATAVHKHFLTYAWIIKG